MKYSLTPWTKQWERWPYGTKRSSLESFFDDMWGADRTTEKQAFLPAVDVEETENQYLLKMDLPGFKKEDIKIDLHNNRLTLSGERKSEKVEKNKNMHLEERTFGEFKRTFELPENVDDEKVDASYEHGVLYLKLTKTNGHSPRRIEIKG